MTTQDWKEVEERLKSFYDAVELAIDQYKVNLVLERISQFKNVIMVYINGKIDWKWSSEDCEERRRFFQPCTKSLVSPKQKKSLSKISKRLRKEVGLLDPDVKYTFYRPYWTSFKSLKRHLTKNNDSIELVTN